MTRVDPVCGASQAQTTEGNLNPQRARDVVLVGWVVVVSPVLRVSSSGTSHLATTWRQERLR